MLTPWDLADTRPGPPPIEAAAKDARENTGEPRSRAYRPDIEGLRAIAIILVVLYHAGVRHLPGGYVGVDVFFVISGFLITSHLVGEAEGTGRLDVARFYGRRVLRLLPAATFVLAATLLATWFWLPATRLTSIARDAIAANGYVLNYRLAVTGTDYRNISAAPSPLQHFWSLAVEEQFYLVVPLLLVLSMVAARSRTAFTAAVALITAGSLAWSVASSAANPIWAYFGAPTRVWELGLGALLAVAAPSVVRLVPHSGDPDDTPVVPLLMALAGLAAIGYAAVQFSARTTFPGGAALVPTLGAALVLAAGTISPTPGLGMGWMQAVGARSYSWYLWHWPVIVIAPYALGRTLGVAGNLLCAAVAYLGAAASYALLEHPLRSNPTLRDHPARALGAGLGLTAGVVVLALVLPLLPPHVSQGIGRAAPVRLSGTTSAKTRALARRLSAAAEVKTLPKNLTPSLKQAADDEPAVSGDGCLLGYPQTRTPNHCEHYGDASSKTVVALFGDSHAAQWFPAVQAIARQRHWRLAVLTKIVCSPADVKIYLDATKGYNACVSWRKKAISQMNALHPALILVTGKVDGEDAVGLSGSASRLDADWGQALARTLGRLKASDRRVVYLDDTPAPKENVPDCLSDHPRNVPTCAQDTDDASTSGRRTAMLRAAQSAGATLVDPARWFCTSSTCPVVVGNVLVYRDESHVSGAYVRLVQPLLSEQLKPAPRKKK